MATILIVEDNPDNQKLISHLLRRHQQEVVMAGDAQEARLALATSRPDLILMDMQLPGTDGLTLVQEIRTRAATTKLAIIALTAHAMRGDRERFLAGGCDGYIAKPIDAASFVDQIRAIAEAVATR